MVVGGSLGSHSVIFRRDMAASAHQVTGLTSSPSSTASSPSTPVLTWNLNPLILSSAVILACLISTVVSAAKVEDILVSSQPLIRKNGVGNNGRTNTIFTVRTNTIDTKHIHNSKKATKLPYGTFEASNDMRNLAISTGTSTSATVQSTILTKVRGGLKTLKSKLSHRTVAAKRHSTGIGLTTYSNILDDKPHNGISNSFVNVQSSAGVHNLISQDLMSLNVSFDEDAGESVHGQASGIARESAPHAELNRAVERLITLNSKWSKFEFSESPNSGQSDVSNDPLKSVEFKPLPANQLPNLRAQTKRYPRSIDSNVNDDSLSSPEDEIMSRTLHYVDDLQSKPAPCPSPNDRIIILKTAKFRPDQFFPAFPDEVNKTVQIANTINDLLLFTRSPPEDFLEIFFAMTQSLVESGPQVTGCAIAFNLLNPNPVTTLSTPVVSATSPSSTASTSKSTSSNSEPQSLFPYSYRTRDGAVVVTDLSMLYRPQTTTWFSVHVNRSTEGLLKPKNRIYANKTDMGNLTYYNAKWNKTVSVTPADGYWTTPYYDCLLRSWVVQYSVPFYQLEGSTPEFKGVVLLEANFETININQCADDGSLFSHTHRCRQATTQCKNIPGNGLRLGSYKCTCKEGYQFPLPDSPIQFFDGKAVERAYMDYISNNSSNYTTEFNCLVMRASSSHSTQLHAEAIVTFDFLARGIPLGIQSFCMTIAVVVGIIIVCLRKTKVMRSSLWILLEMILFGAIFLYATILVQYFEPTTTSCILLPWFREVGFVIVYGVLVLKIYRILAEFQSRKAHRVHVRDKDLFKYLAVILTVVIAYMSAWTAVNIDHLDNNSTVLEQLYTEDTGLTYALCRSMWWDYAIETGEFIFLCCGIYMCYCVRSAPTEYSEGRYITAALCYEAVVSSIFYILRHLWWHKMHPDHLFLMFFLRCQLTVTVVLFIILGPKLWYAHRPPDARCRAYSQSDVQDSLSPETMKLNVGISSNGDVEVGEISLTEMDPEDIRAELKRLYTQLQIYKTKTMRKDNPHISKRRGGRKQTHPRRFSLQAFHHKHRHHHDHDHDHEMSKTPEESTNSAEAMTFTIEPSVKEDPNEGRSVPSVSFKSGLK